MDTQLAHKIRVITLMRHAFFQHNWEDRDCEMRPAHVGKLLQWIKERLIVKLGYQMVLSKSMITKKRNIKLDKYKKKLKVCNWVKIGAFQSYSKNILTQISYKIALRQ